MSSDEIDGDIKQFDVSELVDFKRMLEAGVTLAGPAAQHYCVTYGLAAPAWVTKASADFHLATLRQGNRQRGRSADPVARYLQDMRHYARWDAVDEITGVQKQVRKQIAELERLKGSGDTRPQRDTSFRKRESILNDRKKVLARVGRNLEDACHYASKLLEETEAFGSPHTIRASYNRVRKDFRGSKRAACYSLLNHRFVNELFGRKRLPIG
jgi:hypothetical protein